MDRPGDEFLPRSLLSGDEHPALLGGHKLDGLLEAPHRGALSDQRPIGAEVLLEKKILFHQKAVVDGVTDGENHLLQGERLLQEVEGPGAGRLDGHFDRRVA